ncbi:MAG: FtsX-like permease family protein [Termitinemataceae bacterium]
MKIRSRLFMAWRYLVSPAPEGSRYLRGAALGIAISMIPIIVTLIVADGMIQGITNRYLELGSGHLQIYDYRAGHDDDSFIEIIQQTKGVRSVYPEAQSLGILVGKNGKYGANLRAVSQAFFTDSQSLQYLQVLEGSLGFDGNRSCILGNRLAKQLGISAGDTVRLMTMRTSLDGTMMPRITSLKVQGVVSSGYAELDGLWCFIPWELGNLVFPIDARRFLMIKIEYPYTQLEDMQQILQERIGDLSGIYTWKELQATQFKSFESTRQMLIFIMALIVCIAAVNVSAAISMLVVERRREIAILRASGASAADIRGIFVYAAFVTAALGSSSGIAFGLIIGYTINEILHGLETILSWIARLFQAEPVVLLNPAYYLERIPVVIDWSSVGAVLLVTIIGAVIVSIKTAWRASTLLPVEIIQKY